MGYVIVIGLVLLAILVIASLARYGGNYAKRLRIWHDPSLSAISREYDLHVRVIERLIVEDIAWRRMDAEEVDSSGARPEEALLGLPNGYMQDMYASRSKAILAGLDWMRRVKMSRDPSIVLNDPQYLRWFRGLEDRVRKEQEENPKLYVPRQHRTRDR